MDIGNFKKEVDEVLALVQAAKNRALTPESSQVAADPQTGRQELNRLELSVEELQRKLESLSLQLEAEQRKTERCKEQIRDLTRQAADSEEQTAEFKREALTHAARAKEIDDTLQVSLRARAQLNAALDEEKLKKEVALVKVADLQGRLDAAGPSLDEKEQALRAAERRYEEACKIFLEATTEYHKEAQRMGQEIQKLRSYEAERQARWEQQQRAMETERERLHASLKFGMDNAELIRKEGVEALEQARKLKADVPPKQSEG